MRENTWLRQAVCLEVDPEIFHPEGNQYSRAAVVCAVCPVRQLCLDDALEYEERNPIGGRFGMFGGMTPSQRDAEAIARRKARRATASLSLTG